MTAALRIGGLFEGYGGLTMAVRQVLGGELAWVSDNHPSAVKLLTERYPGVPNLGDITGIDWDHVEPVDVLTAGFPCQDISNAGQRAGIEGKRSGLWSHVVDAIRVLRPRLVVLENVSALVVRGLDRVLADLAALGFDAEWTTLRASDIGAPHRRERWFLVAVPSVARGVAPDPAGDGRDEGWAEPTGIVGGPDAALGGVVVGDAAVLGWDGSPAAAGCGEPAGTTGGPGLAAANSTGNGHGHTRETGIGWVPAATVAGGQRAPATDSDGDGQQQREGDLADLAGRAGDRSPLAWGDYGPAVHRWGSILGRPAPSPTVLSDRYLKMLRLRLERQHPKPVGMRGSLRPQRVLNTAFVEWLMGVAEGWVTAVPGLSRNDMLRLLGNGVVPQQGAAALRYLLAQLPLTSVSAA